ncbi:GNAT family N-acetyltransferase [Paenibacillus thermotolerans]|uniref:GNAT family N-acetyltransferase n=1 Tax=Paenibacillus thermotolerans TaxID=3027807 RepID=UPI0023683468|nr:MULTISPECIES: GNAT family N-acetyltransferase [unclassified Paenibacillus]
MHGVSIRKVNHLDPSTLNPLVASSAGEGFRHLKRLVSEYETGANTFDKVGEALFLAYLNSEVVGVCGLNQDPYSNRKEVGRVRRLYVSPHVRRFGVGRLLMKSVIEEAGKHYKKLVLRTDQPIADQFYRSIGFSVECNSEYESHFLHLE